MAAPSRRASSSGNRKESRHEPTNASSPRCAATARAAPALITLNRPKQLNALNDALMDELGAALKAFDADDAIGCIVVTGSEKAFAAGADIAAMAQLRASCDAYKSDFITRNWETMRAGAQAGDRRGRRLRARRRLRAGDDVRHRHRRRHREVRPARDQARHHPRRRRHAAAAARGRQGEGDGHGADRPHDGRGRGRARRAGLARRAGRRAAGRGAGRRRRRSARSAARA